MGNDPAVVGAPAPDADQAAGAILVTRRDDAADEQAQAYEELARRLRETEARLRALEATFEAVTDGIFVMDAQGRVLQLTAPHA
jgi:PAS domain-containing protein